MVFNPNNYFDIWNILAYEIIGGVGLTIIIGYVIISYLSLRYAVPFQVTTAMIIFWTLVISAITGYVWLFAFGELAAGLIFYLMLIKVFKRA